MKIAVIVLVALLLAPPAGGERLRSNVIVRVMPIEYEHAHGKDSVVHRGAAFTIEVGAKQYLITAKHVLHDATAASRLSLAVGDTKQSITAIPIFPRNPEVDIVALPLKEDLTPRLPLEATLDKIAFSQQIFFLGYPFGLRTRTATGQRVAFVKSGIVAAIDSNEPSRTLLYLDAHNNVGFSGGPVVFWHEKSKSFRVCGVVSGYEPEQQPVYRELRDQKGKLVPGPDGNPVLIEVQGVTSRENPGIMLAHSIGSIVEAIEQLQNSSPVTQGGDERPGLDGE